MYAIIEVGAKQYSVTKGDIIEVEKQSAQKGAKISLDKVLLIAEGNNIQIGQPYLKGAHVEVEALGQIKGEKLVSFKYRRRKSSRWNKGHRQQLTRLKVKEITL